MTSSYENPIFFLSMRNTLYSRYSLGASMALIAGASLNAFAQKPNIILFNIDDMGWVDVANYGNPYIETPNIDALAQDGMKFTSAYASAPNCAPSRACLISGQYTPRHGVYTVGSSNQGATELKQLIPVSNTAYLSNTLPNISKAMKDAGYVTATMGKYHVGADPLQMFWDVNVAGGSEGNPGSGGFFAPYNSSILDNNNFQDGPVGEYLTDRLTDEALDFINSNKDTTFFLYLPHYAVHTPIAAHSNLIAKYAALFPQLSNSWHVYLGMIVSVDESVGRVVAEIESLGLTNNTAFFFTSDNGGLPSYTSMAPLRGNKGMLYEGGIREPYIVKWPGHVNGGTTCDVPINNIDFYPTFVEMAGGTVPAGHTLDGLSLLPLLEETGTLSREAIFWHSPIYLATAYGIPEAFRTTPSSAMRKGPWKLIRFYETSEIELYNLRDDIGETNNQAEFLPDTVDMLISLLDQWITDTGAPVPTAENPGYADRLIYTTLEANGGNGRVAGYCNENTDAKYEVDTVYLKVYHNNSLFFEEKQVMTYSGGIAIFNYTVNMPGTPGEYKYKVYFMRNGIVEIDRIITDISKAVVDDDVPQQKEIIAKWTFPLGDDSNLEADETNSYNTGFASLSLEGTDAIVWKNGSSSGAPYVTGWDNGVDTKGWVYKVNSTNINSLEIEGEFFIPDALPGPRDWKVQYKTSEGGTYIDIPNSSILVDQTQIYIPFSVALSSACSNQVTLFVRITVASTTNAKGGTTIATGAIKTDNVVIEGMLQLISTKILEAEEPAVKIFPNPSNGEFNIIIDNRYNEYVKIDLIDLNGKIVYSRWYDEDAFISMNLNLSSYPKGFYVVKTTVGNNQYVNKLLIN